MRFSTSLCHMAHLLGGDVISQGTWSASGVDRALNGRRHKLAVDLDARGHFQVGIDAGDERRLLPQFPLGPRRDAVKDVGDVEHVEVEHGRRYPQRGVLTSHRLQGAGYGLLVRQRRSMVRGA